MNSADFIAKALSIARDYKTSYIWGGLGSPITDASLTRAANAYAKNTEKGWIDAARRYAGNPKAFYFDCVGLIKAILWGWSGDSARTYGGATYPTMNQVLAGACPDISADGMISICSGVSSDFSGTRPGGGVDDGPYRNLCRRRARGRVYARMEKRRTDYRRRKYRK